MMNLHDMLLSPFADFAFMRRALAACIILSISGTPLGLFMNLRRMTLVGDAVSHAILPGVALAFLTAGLNLWALSLGGLLTGIVVALVAIALSRTTQLKDDASFTLVYLLSLAGGTTLLSLGRGNVDLMHILFGNILGVDNDTLGLIAGVATVTVVTLLACYRGLVINSFDPDFLSAVTRGRRSDLYGQIFFLLLVVNLVAAFQALGTLMALGLMILPPLAARFWARTLDGILPLAIAIAIVTSYAGLLLSYHAGLPSGPAIVLCSGGIALISAIIGRHGSVLRQLKR